MQATAQPFPDDLGARPLDPLRDRILSSATVLFQQYGFQGATSDDIAHLTGITKRTLYRRMGDKETILYEIQQRVLECMQKALIEIRNDDGPKLKRIISLHIETIASNAGSIQVLYEEMKNLSPPHRQLVIDARRDYWNLVPAALAADMGMGRLRAVDAKLATHGVLGAVNGTCIAGTSPTGVSVPLSL
jgi:AcrR family transcriptional regulator